MLSLITLLGALLIGSQAEPVDTGGGSDADTIGPADVPKDAPRFSDYPAKIVRMTRPAAPDVHSTRSAREFRTMVRYEAASGPDFAGHYTLMGWGCGAGCTSWAIEDALTGKIVFPPQVKSTQDTNVDPAIGNPKRRSVDYKPDSRLIIVPGMLNEDERTRGISYFVWNGRRLNLVRFVPHLLRAQITVPSTP